MSLLARNYFHGNAFLTIQSVEKTLWMLYEKEMRGKLGKYPSLMCLATFINV